MTVQREEWMIDWAQPRDLRLYMLYPTASRVWQWTRGFIKVIHVDRQVPDLDSHLSDTAPVSKSPVWTISLHFVYSVYSSWRWNCQAAGLHSHRQRDSLHFRAECWGIKYNDSAVQQILKILKIKHGQSRPQSVYLVFCTELVPASMQTISSKLLHSDVGVESVCGKSALWYCMEYKNASWLTVCICD